MGEGGGGKGTLGDEGGDLCKCVRTIEPWSLGCEKSPSPGGYLSYEVLLSFDQSENSMTRIMLHVGRLLLDRQGCVILGSFGESANAANGTWAACQLCSTTNLEAAWSTCRCRLLQCPVVRYWYWYW